MKRALSCLALMSAAAVCLWLAPNSPADDKTKTEKTAEDFKNVSDADFARKASAGGLAEVNLSRIAIQRASSAAVRKFAQQMLDDHTKANQELIALANTKGMTLARTMDQKHEECSQRLMKLEGAEFDRAFVKDMLKDHKEAVALFEAKSRNAQDPDVKRFASTTLPTLQHHLEMVRNLANEKERANTRDQDKQKTIKDRP